MEPDGQIILCNCIRMMPNYSDDSLSCNFSVDQGRILLFKVKGEWKMKHSLGHRYETVWYTKSEWTDECDFKNMFKPDPLDVDVYYLLYKDELSATLTVDDRFADFHQYVIEILKAGVKMICMMNSDVPYTGSKRSKKSDTGNDISNIIEKVICHENNNTNTKNKIIDNFYKKENDISINKNINRKEFDTILHGKDVLGSISKKWDWDDISVGKKRVHISSIDNDGLHRDVHRMMVEIFLPHFKDKIGMVKNGKRGVTDMQMAPDMIYSKYVGNTSSFYVSRASMYVK